MGNPLRERRLLAKDSLCMLKSAIIQLTGKLIQ